MQVVERDRHWSPWFLGLPLAIGAGIVYAPLATLVVATLGLLGAGAYVVALRRPSLLVIELPVSLLLLSTFIIRVRDHDALAENPLDPAGLYRVIAVGLAGLMALVALLYSRRRATAAPFTLYALYVLGVFIAVPLSVNPALTAYRGIELITGIFVVLAIWRSYGEEGLQRFGRLLFAFLVVSLVVVWVEVALVPSYVQRIPGSAIPFRIGGYFPVVSANDVGFYGVTLFLWSLARLTEERTARPWHLRLIAVLGLMSLIGAQYRTGYVCAVVGLLILGWIRRSYRWTLALVAISCLVLLFRPDVLQVTEGAQAVWRRGEAIGTAPTITGRFAWWDASIPVWQESPVFGKGLLTATRFEVLAPLGAIPSTIHNAWVEALVGTGILGVVLLGLSAVLLINRVLGRAWRREACVPLILLSILLVRTMTGSSFEIFGYGALLYGYLALTASRRSAVVLRGERVPETADTTAAIHQIPMGTTIAQ